MYDNHGKQFGEKSPKTPVCDLCTEFRRKRVNTWLQSLAGTPICLANECIVDKTTKSKRDHSNTARLFLGRDKSNTKLQMVGVRTERSTRMHDVESPRSNSAQIASARLAARADDSMNDVPSTPQQSLQRRPIINGWTSELTHTSSNSRLSIRLSPVREAHIHEKTVDAVMNRSLQSNIRHTKMTSGSMRYNIQHKSRLQSRPVICTS